MQFNIDKHIAMLEHEQELWGAAQSQAVKVRVERIAPFEINQLTINILYNMEKAQKKRRDNFEKYSVDYQVEWSFLLIMENIRKLVELSLEEL